MLDLPQSLELRSQAYGRLADVTRIELASTGRQPGPVARRGHVRRNLAPGDGLEPPPRRPSNGRSTTELPRKQTIQTQIMLRSLNALEDRENFEISTCGLRDRCSASELPIRRNRVADQALR